MGKARGGWLRVFFWLALISLVLGVVRTQPWQWLPPQWNPLAELAIDHPMTPVTGWKLRQLRDEPEECLEVLRAAPDSAIDFVELEDYTPVEGCPLTNVVRIRETGVRFNAPFTVTCPLAVSWLMFERQSLQPLAQEHLGRQVARVDHFGSFSCRNVYHREGGRLSEHATAEAFDVAAFTLEDGARISVLEGWDNDEAPDQSRFLRQAHQGACGYFGNVLGPDYNQPHENHFHLGMRGWRLCR